MSDENFILVKKERIATAGFDLETKHDVTVIASVVRSYLTEKRAFQDLEILQDAQPEAIYDVISISHIDD